MHEPPLKSNGKVFTPGCNFYDDWRAGNHALAALHELRHAPPPERLLQAIWQHQRLLRDQLHTLDGQAVRVLHPGFINHEAGPDFRGAVVQIGDGLPRSGDVEIDLKPGGWQAHGHDGNPAYHNVLLHVVWDGGSKEAGAAPGRAAAMPTVALQPWLDAPLSDLALWLGSEAARAMPETLAGQCTAPLRDLPDAERTRLLQQAALVRLQGKAAQFQARARQAGWEQALWEGLFRALGYKHNAWPMQNVAELRSRWAGGPPARATARETRVLQLQALLLGVSGLLPAELTRTQADTDRYLRRVWDIWWRARGNFSDCIVPRAAWRFHNLRPANHPQRRLALAANWVAASQLPVRLERWFTASWPDAALPRSLLEVLQVERDDFWSWHWTFRSARLPKPQPLLGAARVTDLAVNVILPWLWMRAREGKNESLQCAAERRYFAWPAAADNAVLRLARQRLLGAASAASLRGAAAQQGLLQIVRDFCDHSDALCANCRFPELVHRGIPD